MSGGVVTAAQSDFCMTLSARTTKVHFDPSAKQAYAFSSSTVKLGLDTPVSALLSSKVLHVVFFHLVHNSAHSLFHRENPPFLYLP